MNVDLLIRIAGVGILVSVLAQILNRTGREDMAMLVRALRLAMDTRENSRVSLCNPSGRALLA